MSSPGEIRGYAWTASELGAGILALARESGLDVNGSDSLELPEGELHELDLEGAQLAVDATAAALELEGQPVEVPFDELEAFLVDAGPAVVRCPKTSRFWMLLPGASDVVVLLGPGLVRHRVARRSFETCLLDDDSLGLDERLGAWFREIDLGGERAQKVRDHILAERLRHAPFRGAWLLRPAAHRDLRSAVERSPLRRDLALFASAYAFEYGLLILSWWLLGHGALSGRLDTGWLVAWILVLLTTIPLRVASTWYEGRFAIDLGAIVRTRLLSGVLRLTPDETRARGMGHHLGRVLESSALESLALGGGGLALMGLFELLVATLLMWSWGGGPAQAALSILWVAGGAVLAMRYYRRRKEWTDGRLDLSHRLSELMIGHRTRLAQQLCELTHEGEDAMLASYLERSSKTDSLALWLNAWPRGWLLMGAVPVALGFVWGGWPLSRLAVALGALLLGERAIAKSVNGLAAISDARVAWLSMRELMSAALRREEPGDPRLVLSQASETSAKRMEPEGRTPRYDPPWLEVKELGYRYHGRAEPTLASVSASLKRGDKVVLEAPSGGGKSTLVSILAGVRRQDSGLVLVEGCDRSALGELGWTRRVATAPQFHENHVVSESFAFNLLMGRRWPPTAEDLEEARLVCDRLGLSELIAKMPGGLHQPVGETGWQLSHGEKSRLFLARALLQGAELVILDESFGALDPETLAEALSCAEEQASTLLVATHP